MRRCTYLSCHFFLIWYNLNNTVVALWPVQPVVLKPAKAVNTASTCPVVKIIKDRKKRISKEEYVGIIVDILKLRKNVCLCRHFQSLNKDSLFSLERKSVFDPKTPKKLYIDVWLVDFFSPSYTNVCDTSSLFILQLVNISLYMSVFTIFCYYFPDFLS